MKTRQNFGMDWKGMKSVIGSEASAVYETNEHYINRKNDNCKNRGIQLGSKT